MLVEYAKSKGATDALAEEIVHEAFAKYSKYQDIEKVQNHLAFLRTMIVNLIRDHFRRTKIVPMYIGYDENQEDVEPINQPNPEESLIINQSLRLAMDDLSELSELTKQILIDNRVNELTLQELSNKYELTVAKVRRHLRNAIVHLTKKRTLRHKNL